MFKEEVIQVEREGSTKVHGTLIGQKLDKFKRFKVMDHLDL